ncbi:molybdate ABC transporter permease subunit [Acidomonas methanolica]|uniref:Molybdenum transport system permease n=2 Tax=Acidomonas methanolica TaxID=437 RepID=A0A023D766_ACIMT|nr:molybdate ABC transporter permease subunit [Acidomonas methanolica]MBU2653981.1 molybdate ABC transporter permease subunit [Acidomonas methanolica]TCS30942.1 molybdate transport system permease protein [Acidomonas methanolica]GAJ29929.1 ABC transporter molybdenum permease [Acidomonas methanolica NBRC 104435]GEK98260.1 molybdenum ABC transporter permease subunit [Acidomonas methanolica NBRC 104435]
MDPDLGVAIWLTVKLATVTTVLSMAVGAPIAWRLARGRGFWRDVAASVLSLPMVLPPTVLGFYMLLLLGPRGPGGAVAGLWGARTLAFSFGGLVFASVAASLPFVIQSARAGFESVDPRLIEAAWTLRATPLRAFVTVGVPLAAPGLAAAAVLAFAHTVGEFGLILMIGGDLPGRTRVLSIALYDAVESDRWGEAHWIAGGMVAFSFLAVLGLTVTQRLMSRSRAP